MLSSSFYSTLFIIRFLNIDVTFVSFTNELSASFLGKCNILNFDPPPPKKVQTIQWWILKIVIFSSNKHCSCGEIRPTNTKNAKLLCSLHSSPYLLGFQIKFEGSTQSITFKTTSSKWYSKYNLHQFRNNNKSTYQLKYYLLFELQWFGRMITRDAIFERTTRKMKNSNCWNATLNYYYIAIV